MLRNFAKFFIIFGLSFLVESFGWTDQGHAFVYIDLGIIALLIILVILISLFVGDGFLQKFGISIIAMISYVVLVAIVLFATWCATKLFPVDFVVAYQIMTFGQCLCSPKTNEKD